MRKHPDPGVRSAVTNGLHATERPDGIDTIIELMNDPDDNVRDWATFALGTQCDLDSPFVRDALRKQLNDSFENVRDEALSGLARRRDPETLRLLVQRLNADEWVAGDEMAAAQALGVHGDTPVDELRRALQEFVRPQ